MCQGSEELSRRTRTRQGSRYRLPDCRLQRNILYSLTLSYSGHQDPAPGRGLEAEGRLVAGPQLLCTLPRNRALPIEFSLLALGT